MGETRAMFLAIIERLDVQGARIEALSNDVVHLNGDMAQVKSDIGIMKSDIVIMKSDIGNMKSEISEIKSGRTKQDKILEMLSLRSIEQESDIRLIS